jgi:cytoskeletal protein CcmA (bactofilin family)
MKFLEKQLSTNRQLADSRIDFEATIQGNIDFNGTFFVDGAINGDLKGKSLEKTTAIIGVRGKLSGNLFCTNAIIAGTVWGDIHAKSLELQEGARVIGDLYYESLEINPAAEINGNFIPTETHDSDAQSNDAMSEQEAVRLLSSVGKFS